MGIDLAKEELQSGNLSAEEVLVLLEDIRTSSSIAVGILNGLLDYDKIERGAFQMEFEKVCVLKLLLRTVKAADVQAKQKGVRLELLDKKALLANLANLYIEADIHKMGEVMRNLLSNAIKFTPRSGYVHVKVIVTDASQVVADSDKSGALSLSAVSLQSALLRAGRVQSRVDSGAEGQSKRANGTDKKMVLRIEVTDSGAGISP
eukprot:gene6341-8103_t